MKREERTTEDGRPPAWTIILPLATVVIAFAAIFGTWQGWTVTDLTSDPPEETNIDFGLNSFTVDETGPGTEEFGYAEIAPAFSDVEGVFDWTLALLIATIVVGIGTVALLTLPHTGLDPGFRISPALGRGALGLTAVLAIAVCAQVAFSLPGALGDSPAFAEEEDDLNCESVDDTPADTFWGECSSDAGGTEWGAAWAWYATLVGGVVSGAGAAVPWVKHGSPEAGSSVRAIHLESEEAEDETVVEVGLEPER